MKFIVAISLLIIGFAYVNAAPSVGSDVAADVDLGVGLPMDKLKAENSFKGNLGATANSLKTVVAAPFAWGLGTANGLFDGGIKALTGAFDGFMHGGIGGAARGASEGLATGMGEGFAKGANVALNI